MTGFLQNITLRTPEYLWAFLAVPLLWWLLRLIPPEAVRRRFPSLKLFQNLPPLRAQTAFTPFWLVLLRGLLFVLLITGFAEPVWNADAAQKLPPDQPVIIVLDNCWAAAPNWPAMRARAQSILSILSLTQNIAVLAACPVDANYVITHGLTNPPQAWMAIANLKQQDALPEWPKLVSALRDLELAPIAQLNMVSSGVADDFTILTREMRVYDDAHIFLPEKANLPLSITLQENGNLSVTAQRLVKGFEESETISLYNRRQRLLADFAIHWNADETIKTTSLPVPPQELDEVQTIKINGKGIFAQAQRHAAHPPPRIGLAKFQADKNPLSDPQHYLRAALMQQTQVIEDDWPALLAQNLPVIVTVESELPQKNIAAIENWIADGGRLIRFAGAQLPRQADSLMPSPPLRIIQSGEQKLLNADGVQMQPFPPQSPLAAQMKILPNNFATRWLMSPHFAQGVRVWANFSDGTPMVLAQRMGKGVSVFVTAPPLPRAGDWAVRSGLPEFLRALGMAGAQTQALQTKPHIDFNALAAMNGRDFPENVLPADLSVRAREMDLSPWLFVAAFLLFAMDQFLILVRFSGAGWTKP